MRSRSEPRTLRRVRDCLEKKHRGTVSTVGMFSQQTIICVEKQLIIRARTHTHTHKYLWQGCLGMRSVSALACLNPVAPICIALRVRTENRASRAFRHRMCGRPKRQRLGANDWRGCRENGAPTHTAGLA